MNITRPHLRTQNPMTEGLDKVRVSRVRFPWQVPWQAAACFCLWWLVGGISPAFAAEHALPTPTSVNDTSGHLPPLAQEISAHADPEVPPPPHQHHVLSEYMKRLLELELEGQRVETELQQRIDIYKKRNDLFQEEIKALEAQKRLHLLRCEMDPASQFDDRSGGCIAAVMEDIVPEQAPSAKLLEELEAKLLSSTPSPAQRPRPRLTGIIGTRAEIHAEGRTRLLAVGDIFLGYKLVKVDAAKGSAWLKDTTAGGDTAPPVRLSISHGQGGAVSPSPQSLRASLPSPVRFPALPSAR